MGLFNLWDPSNCKRWFSLVLFTSQPTWAPLHTLFLIQNTLYVHWLCCKNIKRVWYLTVTCAFLVKHLDPAHFYLSRQRQSFEFQKNLLRCFLGWHEAAGGPGLAVAVSPSYHLQIPLLSWCSPPVRSGRCRNTSQGTNNQGPARFSVGQFSCTCQRWIYLSEVQ